MANLNQVTLAGRLTKDPELRSTNNDTPVCEVGLAVNRHYTTSGGEQRKETMFIDCVFWNKSAVTISKHAQKGSGILLVGRLELDKWEKDGKPQSRHRVVVDNFQFVGARPESAKAESGELVGASA